MEGSAPAFPVCPFAFPSPNTRFNAFCIPPGPLYTLLPGCWSKNHTSCLPFGGHSNYLYWSQELEASFRATSHFLLHEMILFTACSKHILMAFTFVPVKTYNFPRNTHVLCSGVSSNMHQGWEAMENWNMLVEYFQLATAGAVLGFTLFGWLTSESRRKGWGHYTIQDNSGMLSR